MMLGRLSRVLRGIALGLLIVAATADQAWACPNCKEAVTFGTGSRQLVRRLQLERRFHALRSVLDAGERAC